MIEPNLVFWAILTSSLLAVVILALLTRFYRRQAQVFYKNWQQKQTSAYRIGASQVKGDIYQILGTFSALEEYDQIMMLSTTSKQSSLDLLGIKNDSLDFIEFKKKGASLAKNERKIEELVTAKKVRYLIKDVELPEIVRITERL